MYFLSNNVEEKILHGTTTVGIKAKDGIVLCADMRASAGYFIANNNTMKIQKIDLHAGLTLAGGVADAQNIVDILSYHSNLHRVEKQGPISIHSLARLCSLIFHQNRGYPFMADILVGEGSRYKDRDLAHSEFHERGIVIVGIRKRDGKLVYAPTSCEVVEQGDRLIVLGSGEGFKEFLGEEA